VFVYDDDGQEEFSDPDMSCRSTMSGADLKHWLKKQVGMLLSMEKMNPNNPAIE
jgi:hypothetical protein